MPIGQVPGGGRPFGGIYQVDTSSLDDLSKRLMAQEQREQATRQAQALKMANLVDDTYTKIKAVDQPIFTQKINEWKQASKDLLKAKHLKGDAYIQKQAEVNKKYADALGYAQRSIDDKEEIEQYRKRYSINPKEFNENAHTYLEMRMNTPVGYLEQGLGPDGKPFFIKENAGPNGVAIPKRIDLRDPNNIMWQNFTNWGNVLKKVVGDPVEQGNEVKSTDPNDKLVQVSTKYKGPKNPAQIYTGLSMVAATDKGGGEAIVKAFPFTAEDAINITAKFEEWKNKPEVKQMYPDGINFPVGSDLSQAGLTAKLAAMQIAMNTPITPINKSSRKVTATMDKQQEQRIAMEMQRYGHSLSKMYAWWGLREQSGENVDKFADDAYNSDLAEARENGGKLAGVDPTKKKIIFGSTFGGSGEVSMDQEGNYVMTDPNSNFNPVKVSAADAKAKIRIARKTAFVPGVNKPKPNNPKPAPKPVDKKTESLRKKYNY